MALLCGLFEKFKSCMKLSRCRGPLLDDDAPSHSFLPPVASPQGMWSPRPHQASMAETTWSAKHNPFEAACAGGERSTQAAVDPWSLAAKSLSAQETSLTPSTSSGSSSSTDDPSSKGVIDIEAVEDQRRPYEILDDAQGHGAVTGRQLGD